MTENQQSVGDMLRQAHGRGVSLAELGRMLGRSPRMVSKVIRGESTGEAYRAAVTELHERGTVSAPPARRRAADGHVVPVRAAEGATTTPEDPARLRAPRGRFTERVSELPGGARLVELTAPKTRGTKGRSLANSEIVSAVRRAAQGQRWDRKKVKFQVTTSSGRSFSIGDKHGYQVSAVLGRAHAFSGDALGWLKSQSKHRYEDLEKAGVTITGVTMTVYNHRDETSF